MNPNKLTQKSLEALQTAQNIAAENQNQEIAPAHLLYALTDQNGGLIGSLLEKTGVNTDQLLAELNTVIEAIPRVSGPGRQPGSVYISAATDQILAAAEKSAEG
ncbi:MAG: type VI secretion system ATPase TssH, partial [Firmicutes bacterium]|nr:type VI secretion system ATPase TssH [Bacillota bacterium]